MTMQPVEIIKQDAAYTSRLNDGLNQYQNVAEQLCLEYNTTAPQETKKRQGILSRLLGTYDPVSGVIIKPAFRCDYGFNIHLHGFALINYNCTILDTSPVHIGKGVFIAPNVCISCAGHAIDPAQRQAGVCTSAPITIGDGVWLGANVVVAGGVTIGEGSVIGAGSVVTRDIPAGVVAFGSPCKPHRRIDAHDTIDPATLAF